MNSSRFPGELPWTRRKALAPLRPGGARTSHLDRDEVAMPAGLGTTTHAPVEKAAERPSEQVDPSLRRLIDGWSSAPALLCDRLMNVQAANTLGAALLDGLEHADNLFKLAFLDPAATDFFTEWHHIACAATDLLHTVRAKDDHPRLPALIGELSESRDFRRMWAGHDVSSDARRVKRIRHPEVGEITLFCDVFDVQRVSTQHVLVLQAEPGSPSQHALALLGSLAVTKL